ncbi:hypothetical protein B7463_g11146, partial [Scytalidium lignicola]
MSAENEKDAVGEEHIRQGSAGGINARPYRSHKYPACSFCRRRKSRCTRDLNGRSCLLCRLHGLECSQDSSDSSKDSNQGSRRFRHVRRFSKSQPDIIPGYGSKIAKDPSIINLSDTPLERLGSVADEDSAPVEISPENAPNKPNRHIVGPTDAPDVQVLEKYMSPDASRISNTRPSTIYLDDPTNPIVYVKVPRQRIITSIGNGSSGFKQLETIEKILEPFGDEVVKLYFNSFHRAFPILDETSILQAYKDNKLPHTLVCELYSVALVAWNTSDALLRSRPQPDMKYVWRQTVDALNEEYQAPAFPTILATILDLAGRPTTIMTYNALNIGRSVALSRSLGLNRDPSNWSLDQRQKGLRIRTWWGVLIHDWWASLTHGTPPHISPTQYDVPIPDLNMLLPGNHTPLDDSSRDKDDHVAGAQSFITLCRLTEILGEVLPLIYDLRSRKQDTSLKSLRRLELTLDTWEDSLFEWQKGSSPEFWREAPGALNLHLSFLALRMSIFRISLQEVIRSDECDEDGVRQYYQVRCQQAAEAVIRFAVTIGGSDMDKFWLPSSATTLILRCGLEAKSDNSANECLVMAKLLIDHLRQAKDEHNWDLADICLSQCEAVVLKMSEDGQYLDFRRRNASDSLWNNNINKGQTRRMRSPMNQVPSPLDHGTSSGASSIEAPIQGIIFKPSFNDPLFGGTTSYGMQFNDIFGQVNMNNAWDLALPDLMELSGFKDAKAQERPRSRHNIMRKTLRGVNAINLLPALLGQEKRQWMLGRFGLSTGIHVFLSPPPLPTVDLGYATHQATINTTGQYYNFSNIRYAEPPLGNLRFRAPVAPITRNRTINTGQESTICPQANPAWLLIAEQYLSGVPVATLLNESNSPASSAQIPPPAPGTSEDCLFLDVFVPEDVFNKPHAEAPVLVWIYGGGYTGGSKTASGSPAGLIAQSQSDGSPGVIFVAMNYRLGLFGWMSGPTFQEDGTANLGLYDQRLAIEWVKNNIEKFAGSPRKITLIGESAGGGSIMHHITAYGGMKGPVPFQQAIMQSPGFLPVAGNSQQENTYQSVLAAARFITNTNITTTDQLRSLSTTELQTVNAIAVGIALYGTFTFGPVVDGLFVPALPGLLLSRGQFDKRVHVMVGHNLNEGLLFTSPFINNQSAYETFLSQTFPDASPIILNYISTVMYPEVYDSSYGYTTPTERSALAASEISFTCNTRYLDLAFKNKTYSYYFTVPPGLHGEDVPYTFFNGDTSTPNYGVPVNSTVAYALQEFITSFAKTGNPNGKGKKIPLFPMYGNDSEVLDLSLDGLEVQMDTVANSRCDWWQKGLYL